MPLTILLVGYSLAAVGPEAAGGAEQILSALDRGLVAAGHRSIVVGYHGSTAAGEVIATEPVPTPFDDTGMAIARARLRLAVRDALDRRRVDLVHMHGLDFDAALPPPGPPVLVTLHLPIAWYAAGALPPARPRTWLACVSESQHRTAPPDLPLLPPMSNGVDVERLAPAGAKRDYAVALGRICSEKGLHLALDAARAAGVELQLAGKLHPYPSHRAYFSAEIVPRLDHRRRLVAVDDVAGKRALLAAARCLLVPSLAPETSSLVAMEALACGTPVIAFRAGALPEIVAHGHTGFIVDSAEAMAAAIPAAGNIDPQACRAAALARFSHRAMLERYLHLYRALIDG